MPEIKEFPKYLKKFDVVVQSKDEEDALLNGKAEVVMVSHSAEGDTMGVVVKREEEKE